MRPHQLGDGVGALSCRQRIGLLCAFFRAQKYGFSALLRNIPIYQYIYHSISSKSTAQKYKQESWATAKMTERCALYMGALKIFESSSVVSTPTATFAEIFNGLLFRSILWICVQNLKFVNFTHSWDNRGYSKNWAVPGYANAPFFQILMSFCSDGPCKMAPAKLEVPSFTRSWDNRG